jgi:hypothetical protein
LLNLLAVVVAIASISITMSSISSISLTSRLANCNHHDSSLLLKADLNSLGGGGLLMTLVRVRTDLIVNQLNGLSADSTGDNVAELFIDNALDGQVHIGADGLEGRGADLGDLSHISDSAVMLGFFITIVGGGSMMAVGGGVVGGGISRGWLVIGGLGFVGGVGFWCISTDLRLFVVDIAMVITKAVSKAREAGKGSLVSNSQQGEDSQDNECLEKIGG